MGRAGGDFTTANEWKGTSPRVSPAGGRGDPWLGCEALMHSLAEAVSEAPRLPGPFGHGRYIGNSPLLHRHVADIARGPPHTVHGTWRRASRRVAGEACGVQVVLDGGKGACGAHVLQPWGWSGGGGKRKLEGGRERIVRSGACCTDGAYCTVGSVLYGAASFAFTVPAERRLDRGADGRLQAVAMMLCMWLQCI